MRKALVVGIDYYLNINSLSGCVNDANSVTSVLERNSDGTKNFDVVTLTATSPSSIIARKSLKDAVEKLFKDNNDQVALFYFSGHGYIESTGGYLVTSDSNDGDDGFSINDLMALANKSPAKNKIIILDCCHSGIAANCPDNNTAILSEGTTIMTASSSEQYAMEENGSGVFTALFVDAMEGGASNLVGDITPGSIYAHIDQSLGPWDQRPIFKTNVKNFITLRKVQPPIPLQDLKKIVELFPTMEEEFKLDPEFEPTSENPDPGKMKKFAVLQKFNRVNLVVPVAAEHMYYAAMDSKSCKLTVLGKHYWRLVKKGRI
ncbi:caspase family protein [Methanoculleus sp. 7T]|uniref:caspase family protein n=1 Tax=Methanoculleus sp. 7T TaxID=2937282 RepID=UPI0020C0F8EF|nr:caspase family protein [Methanoculleus sp. 7T]MCK8517688.1 caspase family protein [Methanoculleus sp. 7T]